MAAGGVVILAAVLAGAGLWNYHENPKSCGLCHIMDDYVASLTSPQIEAERHHQEGLACLDCHPFNLSQSAGEVITYVTGKYEYPLVERRWPSAECFRCHENKSYAEIIPLTPITDESHLNPHDSHYGELDCGICHKMHKPSVYYCAQCKDVGIMPEGWVAPPGSKGY